MRYVSPNILKVVLKTCWEVFCKIIEKFFCKNTKRWSAKSLCVVCKNLRSEMCSVEILKGICKNIKRWSAKLLSRVPYFDTQKRNFLIKTQGLGLLAVTSWPASRPKDNKQLLRAKSFGNFWYSLKHKKVIQETGGLMIYKCEEIKSE